tara:strand:- start:1838 stop:2410 length:573 start_codon:yes stop_codon:yes gene_type:complete
MEEVVWSDGVAKALRSLASQIEKQEKARHFPEENYYADPHVMVMDIDTGSAVIMQTEPHEGGKTKGRGYRRCPAVQQRVPSKLPQKKIIRRLLKIAIRNFVPTGASADEYSVVVKKAIEDIAKMLVSDEEEEDDGRHEAALQAALSDLLDMTMSTRAGDTLLKVETIPISHAHMDVSAIKEEVELMKVIE